MARHPCRSTQELEESGPSWALGGCVTRLKFGQQWKEQKGSEPRVTAGHGSRGPCWVWCSVLGHSCVMAGTSCWAVVNPKLEKHHRARRAFSALSAFPPSQCGGTSHDQPGGTGSVVKRKCFVFEPDSLHIAGICLKMGNKVFSGIIFP